MRGTTLAYHLPGASLLQKRVTSVNDTTYARILALSVVQLTGENRCGVSLARTHRQVSLQKTFRRFFPDHRVSFIFSFVFYQVSV